MIQVISKDSCSGCRACAAVCPKQCICMECDEEGFFYPNVDKDVCVECGLCEKSCPFGSKIVEEKKEKRGVYAVKNRNIKVQHESSSGGIFFSLAKYFLDNNGIVCGVVMSEDCHKAHHIIIDSPSEIYRLQGSKYLESDVGDVYKEIKKLLVENKPVLFSGTPCQVSGLKSYLGDVRGNLLCVEVICHGVPSQKLWESNLRYIEQKYGRKVKNISFRNKKYGWEQFGTMLELDGGKKKFLCSFEDPYFMMFNSNYALRPSCYNCKVKGERCKADISLGDFWHIQDVIANYYDDKGVSLVLINTEHGANFFEKIKGELDVASAELTFSMVINSNPAIVSSMSKPSIREAFYKELDMIGFDGLRKKYVPLKFKFRVKAFLIKTGAWNIVRKIRK